MRWFVEISGLGKKPGKTATLCVEATQWQPALQRARSIRGDTGSLSAFSIELLDDGYRAIDPSARLKYVVKRAPDDATLSAGGAASDAAPESKREAKNGARSKSSPPPKTSDGERKASASFVPTTKPSEPVKAPSQPPPQADVIEAKPLIAIPLDRPPPPPAAPGLPSYNVQSERSDDPTARSPLYYREVVYVVGDATPASEAERLVRDRFAEVRRSLASARPGKLVRLAVFDQAFSGKPKRPPVVTLTWKDWAGDEPEVRVAGHEPPAPIVSTPRPAPQKVDQVTTLASASKPADVAKIVDAPPTAAPKTVETPKPEPAPAKAEAVVEIVEKAAAPKPEPEPAPAPAAAPVTSSEPPSAVSAKSSSPAISVREPSPSTVNRIIEIAEPPSAAEEVRISEAPAPSPLPGPKTIVDAPRIDVMVDDDYVPPPPASFPTPSIVPPTPSYVPPVPSQPAATQPPPPPVPTVKRKKQLSADDLISELFEAMSDLHFLGDALAGADYVLGVALEKIPCELGFVSLFDINKREFVVVRQRGGPRSVLGFRQPEKAPVALSAMRTKAAVIVDEAGSARATDDRYRAAGVEVRGLLCAPIALGGRYLGVIELANSEDGAFRVADANALTYVGQQLGEFVAERGVIIDAAHILETAKTAAEAQAAQSKRRQQ